MLTCLSLRWTLLAALATRRPPSHPMPVTEYGPLMSQVSINNGSLSTLKNYEQELAHLLGLAPCREDCSRAGSPGSQRLLHTQSLLFQETAWTERKKLAMKQSSWKQTEKLPKSQNNLMLDTITITWSGARLSCQRFLEESSADLAILLLSFAAPNSGD